ncbi:MAG: hypothetical protein AABM67_03700 [Acidobacteriota bacterium]
MTRRRQFIIPGLFIAAGFGVFSTILTSYFLSDDFVQIGKVLNGDFSVVWGRAHGGFFRPLFVLSYIIDAKIWGARPLGFHITNVAVHSLNAFLVFLLSFRLLEYLESSAMARQTVSMIAGALFLLHPSHTEAVSWISGRADLIATFFSLLSLLVFLSHRQTQRSSRLVISLVCFALALLAKESAICVPFLILAIELFARGNKYRWRRSLALSALYVLILLVFIAVRYAFLGSLVGGYGPGQHLNFALPWLRDRLLEALVRSILPALPSQLSPFLFKPLQSRAFILFLLIFGAVTTLIIIFRRRMCEASTRKKQNRFIIALACLFLFSLLPVINLRLTLYQTLGERFLYLPTVFSCLLTAYLCAILVRPFAVWLLILICAVAIYSTTLYRTNRLWKEAALLSQSIKDELANSATRNRLLILNAPDNLKGVPVFHNGLPEALHYFQNQKPVKQVEIIAFQDLQSARDEVQLTWSAGVWRLRLLNKDARFSEVSPAKCWKILSRTTSSLDLRPACSTDADLFVFSNGKMLRVCEPPDNFVAKQ